MSGVSRWEIPKSVCTYSTPPPLRKNGECLASHSFVILWLVFRDVIILFLKVFDIHIHVIDN